MGGYAYVCATCNKCAKIKIYIYIYIYIYINLFLNTAGSKKLTQCTGKYGNIMIAEHCSSEHGCILPSDQCRVKVEGNKEPTKNL